MIGFLINVLDWIFCGPFWAGVLAGLSVGFIIFVLLLTAMAPRF